MNISQWACFLQWPHPTIQRCVCVCVWYLKQKLHTKVNTQIDLCCFSLPLPTQICAYTQSGARSLPRRSKSILYYFPLRMDNQFKTKDYLRWTRQNCHPFTAPEKQGMTGVPNAHEVTDPSLCSIRGHIIEFSSKMMVTQTGGLCKELSESLRVTLT